MGAEVREVKLGTVLARSRVAAPWKRRSRSAEMSLDDLGFLTRVTTVAPRFSPGPPAAPLAMLHPPPRRSPNLRYAGISDDPCA